MKRLWMHFSPRVRHYISLTLLMAGLTLGGLVTLNCDSGDQGTGFTVFEDEEDGVRHYFNGGVVFMKKKTTAVADVRLDASKKCGSWTFPIFWKPVNPIDSVVGSTAVIRTPYTEPLTKVERTASFIGEFQIDDPDIKEMCGRPLRVDIRVIYDPLFDPGRQQ